MGPGVHIEYGAVVEMTRVLIENIKIAGITVFDSETTVSMDTCAVRNTVPGEGDFAGYGMRVVGGATVTTTDCAFIGNARSGMLISGSGTSLNAVRTLLNDTLPGGSGAEGYGVQITNNATGTLTDCIVDGNTTAGVQASHPDTSLELVRTVTLDTKIAPSGKYGTGLSLTGGATGTVSGCLFDGNRQAGVMVTIPDTQINMAGTIIRNTKATGAGVAGHGVSLLTGASAMIRGCRITGNTQLGVVALDSNTSLELRESVVRDTLLNGSGSSGSGLVLGEGAYADVRDCLFEANHSTGVAASHAGTQLALSGTVVRGTLADGFGKYGWGVQIVESAEVTLERCGIVDNIEVGITVPTPFTYVEVTDTVVRDTKAAAVSGLGWGMGVTNGASVLADHCLFEGNIIEGILVDGESTELSFMNSIIASTKGDEDKDYASGIQVSDGASVSISGGLFQENTKFGIWISNSNTSVDISDTVVRETMPDSTGAYGHGLYLQKGGSAAVSRSLFTENANGGLLMGGAGVHLEMKDSVLGNTKPAVGDLGQAAEILGGATATITACLIEENGEVGLVISGPETQVQLERSIIRNMTPSESGDFGWGMQINGGATADLRGCLVDGNTSNGIMTGHPKTSVALTGVIVRNTLSDLVGEQGIGVVGLTGAKIGLRGVLLAGNRTAGLMAEGAGTVVTIEDSAVLSTEPGGGGSGPLDQVYGDGLVALLGAVLEVTRVIISDNARTGIYFDIASGLVVESSIFGNGSHGLAMNQCAELVEYGSNTLSSPGLQDNWIFGNAHGMDASPLDQVTTTPGQLQLPTIPDLHDSLCKPPLCTD